MERRSIEERFCEKVQKTDSCWIWLAKKTNPGGYGWMRLGGKNDGSSSAHRISWIIHNGPIPEGLCVLHRCDVPSCVRPDHLFLGTSKDNTQDMLKKGRMFNGSNKIPFVLSSYKPWLGRMPLEKRFWAKVEKTDGCWEWKGAKCNGYGRIGKGGHNGGTYLAPRVSWEIHNGTIPPMLNVLHKCDNPSCVNPDHLFLGSMKDNVDDMVYKGRHVSVVGEENPKTTLTTAQVMEIRARFKPREVTYRQLAGEFGMSCRGISNIVRRIRWKHI